MKLCAKSPHHGAYETVCRWCEPEATASADADEAEPECAIRLPTQAWTWAPDALERLLSDLAVDCGVTRALLGSFSFDANGSEVAGLDEPFIGDE